MMKKITLTQDDQLKELMDHDSIDEGESSCDVELIKNVYRVFQADQKKRKAKAEASRKRIENNKIFDDGCSNWKLRFNSIDN